MSENAKPQTSIRARLRYAGAWTNYLFKMALMFGGIGWALWYGYQQAGWIGVGLAIVFVSFVIWIFQDDNFDRVLQALGGVIALLFTVGVIVAGIIGIGYLLGVGIDLAR